METLRGLLNSDLRMTCFHVVISYVQMTLVRDVSRRQYAHIHCSITLTNGGIRYKII